jgi:hypothetical protein
LNGPPANPAFWGFIIHEKKIDPSPNIATIQALKTDGRFLYNGREKVDPSGGRNSSEWSGRDLIQHLSNGLPLPFETL